MRPAWATRCEDACVTRPPHTRPLLCERRQWTSYRDALADQADASAPFGANLDAATKSSMNAEQAEQLRELKSRVVTPE